MTVPKNCWEVKQCGRQPGGNAVEEFGACPAAIEQQYDGVNRGVNGGRFCWAIAGTFCGGEVQGLFAMKIQSCLRCPFLKQVEEEESERFAFHLAQEPTQMTHSTGEAAARLSTQEGISTMTQFQEIDNAIAAHGKWKARLKDAIHDGKIDIPVATIRRNDQCAFGTWLYGPTLTAEGKKSENYKTVVELHTQFHKIAAAIAELAIEGKKVDAEKALFVDGELAQISAKLTTALLTWKKSQVAMPTR